MADNNSALDFLRQNAETDANGNFHLTQKNWAKYMSDSGITGDIIKAYHSAEKDLINAMYVYNAEEILKRCEQAKKDGKDPSKEAVAFTVNIPDGSIKFETVAAKTYPIPNEPGQKITKTMCGKLSFQQIRKLDSTVLKSYEEQLAKALGFEA